MSPRNPRYRFCSASEPARPGGGTRHSSRDLGRPACRRSRASAPAETRFRRPGRTFAPLGRAERVSRGGQKELLSYGSCPERSMTECPFGNFAESLESVSGGGVEPFEIPRFAVWYRFSRGALCGMTEPSPLQPDKLRYPSDLTDEELLLVEPSDPAGQARRAEARGDRAGSREWRDVCAQHRMPVALYPPRSAATSTLYGYLQRWAYDGTLEKLHHALYVQCREVAGREASPTACMIDSQSVKSAEKGGSASIRPV